jgi:hypothetical protein
MTIERLFNHAHLLHQETGNEDLPNAPISASIDAGGSLILSQEERHIVVDWGSVSQLKKLLDAMLAIHKTEPIE